VKLFERKLNVVEDAGKKKELGFLACLSSKELSRKSDLENLKRKEKLYQNFDYTIKMLTISAVTKISSKVWTRILVDIFQSAISVLFILLKMIHQRF